MRIELAKLALAFIGLGITSVASAQGGTPNYCSQYPGLPECVCQANPYDVVCSANGQPAPWETYRDEVPPPPSIDAVGLLASPNNPYNATCGSSPLEKYNYAYWAIAYQWFAGDISYMENEAWSGYEFYYMVRARDNTMLAYALVHLDGINRVVPLDDQCW